MAAYYIRRNGQWLSGSFGTDEAKKKCREWVSNWPDSCKDSGDYIIALGAHAKLNRCNPPRIKKGSLVLRTFGAGVDKSNDGADWIFGEIVDSLKPCSRNKDYRLYGANCVEHISTSFLMVKKK